MYGQLIKNIKLNSIPPWDIQLHVTEIDLT